MWKPRVLWTLSVCAVTAVMAQTQLQGKPSNLTPLDYIEIQQLGAKYAYALDTGT